MTSTRSHVISGATSQRHRSMRRLPKPRRSTCASPASRKHSARGRRSVERRATVRTKGGMKLRSVVTGRCNRAQSPGPVDAARYEQARSSEHTAEKQAAWRISASPGRRTTETDMRMTSWITRAGIALLAAVATVPCHTQTLRFGLAEDPDVLDPTLARTFVGRVVFAALCDKLFDVDEKLNIVPQLATSYEWSADRKALTIKLRQGVTFHDGEKLDAAAVKFNIERHKNMAGSNRRAELAPVSSVDVIDAATVRLNLSAPFAPLLAA